MAAPYETSIDTKPISNGQHTVSATARSVDGLTSTTAVILNVQNQVQPLPPPTKPASPLVKLIQAIVTIVIKIMTTIINLLKR